MACVTFIRNICYCKDKNCLHNNNTKTDFLHVKIVLLAQFTYIDIVEE